MKISDLFEEDLPKTLYHVTLTKHVPSIKKKGLLPMQTSNWVKAGDKSRYGNGEIFAFDHLIDAIRWAAKWDWELSKKMGSGDVSIVTFKSKDAWEEDDADPLSQAGKNGMWLKRIGKVSPADIVEVQPVTTEMVKKGVMR